MKDQKNRFGGQVDWPSVYYDPSLNGYNPRQAQDSVW